MTQNEALDTGGESPNKKTSVLKSAPKLGEVFWCSFSEENINPEFYKTRPVIVVSYKNSLHGPILVVPFSTKEQTNNAWAIEAKNVVPSDKRDSWAVCNHLYTVSCSRLIPDRGRVFRIKGDLLKSILTLVRKWIADPEF